MENGNVSGVNVCGFVTGEFGLAEGVRSTIRSLETQNIPIATNDFEIETVQPRQNRNYKNAVKENPFPVNIIQINGDFILDFERKFKPDFLKNKYNIAYWVWELSECPPDWADFLNIFHEIWTPSNFCVKAFLPVSHIPVFKMPYSIDIPENFISRSQLNLASDKFIFLFIFDFASTIERKNPLAIVEAFKEAFGMSDKVLLFLKSIGGNSFKDDFRKLKEATANASNIKVVDGIWNKKDLLGLVKNCDCYVSLHRGEGFGLTMAEAMSCGKPVIATDYSGNSDYLNTSNGYPVRYQLKELETDYAHYKQGNTWAEPDVSHAVELMRRVFEFREEASQIGKRAAEDIEKCFSPTTVGKMMRERLETVNFINDNYFQKIFNSNGDVLSKSPSEFEIKKQARVIENLSTKIEWMEASHFWKIRNRWWSLKNLLKPKIGIK